MFMDRIPNRLQRTFYKLLGGGVLCLMASVMLSACSEGQEPEPVATAASTATPTAVPTPTQTIVPVATLTPSATFVPAPSSTLTFTPSPTVRPEERALERLGSMLPWFDNPPDQSHATASRLITDIWLQDAYIGDAVAQMPWIIDGIAQEEIAALRVIDDFSFTDPELGKGLVDSLWVADGLNEDEFELVDETLGYIKSTDPELAVLLVTAPWAADGLDDAEWHAFQDLVIMGRDHRELTRLLAASSWVADGAGLDEPFMGEILAHFLKAAWKDSEVAKLAATAPWVVDGVSSGEARVIEFVSYYLDTYPQESKALLDLPQAVEGQLVDDQMLYGLVPIAFWNRPAAITVAGFVATSTGDIGDYLIKSLVFLTEVDPGRLEQLTRQPWFTDGLDSNEAAFIVTLDNVALKDPVLYNQLLNSHYIQHRVVTLPLAGSANIWVIQDAPPPLGEDLLKTIEDTLELLNNSWGRLFPPRTSYCWLCLQGTV